MAESARCIYRGCFFNSAVGEGDHIVPAALGEFANLRRFRGVCPECNNDIGKSEAQLLRCGPEAYMARVATPARRRGRDGRAWQGAMGAPPPGMFAERYGARLIVKPMASNPLNREVVDCIDVVDERGNHHPVPIFVGMSAATLRERIKALGIVGKFNVHFSVSADDGGWFDRVADELWPGAERAEFPMTEIGRYPGHGLISFRVNDHYFRAVAKMAFHYYLSYNASGVRGDEVEFANLRRFIIDGGDPEPFFTTATLSPVYFGVPFGDVVGGGLVSSARWCHLLAADDTHEAVVVCLHLFVGPGYVNPPHYVVLGRTPPTAHKRGALGQLLSWKPGAVSKGTVEAKEITLGKRPDTIVGPGLDTSNAANPLFTEYRR